MTTTRGALGALHTLADGRDSGGYTLPEELLAALESHRRLATLTLPEPPGYTIRDAGNDIADALTTGQAVDLEAIAHKVTDADNGRRLTETAQRVAAEAREQLSDRIATTAARHSETVIRDHLAPAYRELLDAAAKAAADLGPHGLNPAALVTAPAKARNAWATLHTLATRHAALRKARQAAVTISGTTPRHDTRGQFAEFRCPHAFTPNWQPGGTTRLPAPPAPEDPVTRLVWLATTAQRAEPWLPTVAEQDEAHQNVYADSEREQARHSHDAAAYRARIGA